MLPGEQISSGYGQPSTERGERLSAARSETERENQQGHYGSRSRLYAANALRAVQIIGRRMRQ